MGTYGKYLESIEYKPNNYNENLVKEIIDNQDSKKTNEDDWGKPNIIMILAESFYDIQNTGLIEFNKELTSNFDRIKSNSTSINLLSPCYGGITANVEFEVMTGSNISNYPNGTIPYMYKYSNANNNYPSIIKELNNNGYYTAYLTPTYPYFFNRKNVYDSMGIDEFISTDELDYIQYVQNTISDEYIIDNVIKKVDEYKNKEESFFLMALTEQTHMPYNNKKYSTYDINIIKSKLDDKDNEAVLCYAQSVYNLDNQINRLYQYIQTLEEPTILVVFADHLPCIKNEKNIDILEKNNYFNTEKTINNYLNKYTTQCFVTSNYDIEKENIKLLGCDLFGSYILNNLNINVSNYFRYLNNLIDTNPATNRYITKINNEIKFNENNENDTRKMINYYMFK